MNAGFNSGIFHRGTACPPGWVGGAIAVYAEQPAQPVNLDTVSGFTFSVEGGTFIGDVQMLKWLVEHHSRDYWAHMAKRNEEGAR